YSYPFETMSVEDYRLLASDPAARKPAPADVKGNWAGRLITLANPGLGVPANPNPVTLSGAIAADGTSSFRVAGVEAPWAGGSIDDLRLVDNNTLIGKWDLGAKLGWLTAMQDCVEPSGGKFWVHFVLTRK